MGILPARHSGMGCNGDVLHDAIGESLMRDYAKVSPQFWTGRTGKAIKESGHEAIIVALYLMTCPHANMIGLYHLPVMYIAHETGLGMEGASKGLARCSEALFCTYEGTSEHVFVHEMARFQIGDQLDPKDKRCLGVANELAKAPKGALQRAFYEKYKTAFHLPKQKPLGRGLQAPPKPRAGTGARTIAGKEPCSASAELFARFWVAYPRKEAKAPAIKAFAKLDPDTGMLDSMLAALVVQKQSVQWRKENGQFIPLPATWINGRRWEDETEVSVTSAEQPSYMAGAL